MNNYVFVESIGGVQLYFDGNASWGMSKNDPMDIVYVGNPSFYVFCLPLLETDFSIFKRKIISALNLFTNDAKDKFKTFPLKEIVTTALSSESDYWAGLALQWVLHIEIDVTSEVLALSKDKRHSQEIRHRAKTLFFYLK